MRRSLFFVSLVTSLFASEPSWYHQLTVKPNFYVGYGEGQSEMDAKQKALSDIASQMHTKIETKMVRNEQSVDGVYSKNIQISSTQNTKADMSDYELVKAEKIDDRYYVGIEYEDISSIDRFVKKIQASIQADGYEKATSAQKNTFFQNTFLAKKLNSVFNKDIEFQLIRKENSWFLRYRNALQHLNSNEFTSLFLTHENNAIEINTNKKNNILHDGDEFLFKVKSAQDGYVSILSIYEDGTVASLLKNIPIKKDKLTSLPDEKYGASPVAGLIEKGKETYDLYVVIYCATKLMFDQFGDGSDDNIADERHKNVQELVDFLNDKNYATLRVVTRPR